MEVGKMSRGSNNYSDVKSSTNNKEVDDDDVVMTPPGFRFHPTDEELVGFYLRQEVEKKPIGIELIKRLDIYKYDPWDLPRVSTVGDKEWYFFCIRGRKYRNSVRPNRVTGSGFWKATGIDKPIYSTRATNDCIGLKKSLVYYRGNAGKGTKTDWMMHEFRLPPSWKNNNQPTAGNIAQEAEVCTLCRIFKRNPSYKKYIPECNKEAAATEKCPNDASSKTCSLVYFDQKHLNLGDSIAEKNGRKHVTNHVDERNDQLLMGQQNSVDEAVPLTAPYSSCWNLNGDEFFRDGNWDELRSVVELGIGTSNFYEYCR